jgi:hypothetical protein
MVADLNKESSRVTADIASSTPVSVGKQWKRLEILHYDLNTCLCETTVMLKSFFCVLPSDELKQFRARLLFLVPAIALRSRGQDPRLARIVPTSRPSADPRPFARVVDFPEDQRLKRHPYKNTDNSGSRDRIPSPRMRPDGTGGPNETN